MIKVYTDFNFSTWLRVVKITEFVLWLIQTPLIRISAFNQTPGQGPSSAN